MSIIDEKWEQLTCFTNNTELKDKLLKDIKQSYTAPGRSYHNLDHVVNLLLMCEENLALLHNPVVVGFSILYQFNTT